MPGDHMFRPGRERHYEAVGESAVRAINASIIAAGVAEPATVLDFACGSGRVARWLPLAFPRAKIDVSDVRADSLAFCSAKFGVGTWLSSEDLDAVSSPRQYDLIWCGSLLTHLSEIRSAALIKNFGSWLKPNGIVVFTLHGRRVIDNMITGQVNYIPSSSCSQVLKELALRRYGYVRYAPDRDIGFSVNTLDWVVAEALRSQFRIVMISENSWDNHQDVIAIQRGD